MSNKTKEAGKEFKATGDTKKTPENSMWRLNFGGCCGANNLYLTLDELKRDNDIVVEKDGMKVVFDSSLEPLVGNSPVDWVKFLLSCDGMC